MNTRCRVHECEPEGAPYYDATTLLPPAWVSPEVAGTCTGLRRPGGGGGGDANSSSLPDAERCDSLVHLIRHGKEGELEHYQCGQGSGLVTDRSVRETSLSEEFGLTCGRAYLQSLLGTTYMAGMLVGSLVSGPLADRHGRLAAVAACSLLAAASGCLGALAPGAAAFGALRFATGFGAMGALMCAFVLMVESLRAEQVVVWALLFNIPFALGEAVLGLEALLVRDWRALQAVAFVPTVLLGPMVYFLVRESPRWLMAVGQGERAVKVLEEMARTNGREVDNFDKFYKNGDKEDGKEAVCEQEGISDLLRSRPLVLRCAWMFYQWFSVTMGYYGLSFSSTSLSGDAYVNFCLNVLVEIPGYLFVALFLDCWGRRPVLVLLQSASGAACVAAGLLHGRPRLAVLQLALSLVGKFGATAAFAIVFLYTAELFPTSHRSSVTGACSTMARVGAILSLLVQHLGHFWGPLPMVLLGATSLVAGALATRFPETTGRPMPDTVREAEDMGKDGEEALWHYDWGRSQVKAMWAGSE